jgi:peroxiredoxin
VKALRERVVVLFVSFMRSWWPIAVIAVLVGVILCQRWEMTRPMRPKIFIKAGDRLPAVVLNDLSGRSVKIELRDNSRATVLYIFSPDCSWCSRNMDAVRELIERARNYRFVGVSRTAKGIREYLARQHLNCPVYISSRDSRQLGAVPTPATIVISPEGVVQKVWFGAYGGRVGEQIRAMFGVELPEVPLNSAGP